MQRYHIFDTALGSVAIAWNGNGITALRLPSDGAGEAERAIRRRRPGAEPGDPPSRVAVIIADIRRYFTGEAVDFSAVPLDLGEQSDFFTRVYAAVRALEWGESTTYGAVAKACGAGPESARAVGQAMGANPIPLIIPCHRVLAAGNRIGGFSAPGGSDSKARMLAMEGVAVAQDTAPEPSTQTSFTF